MWNHLLLRLIIRFHHRQRNLKLSRDFCDFVDIEYKELLRHVPTVEITRSQRGAVELKAKGGDEIQ